MKRRVFILGLGAPSTYRCGRCGYWHLGSLELPAIRRLLPLILAISAVALFAVAQPVLAQTMLPLDAVGRIVITVGGSGPDDGYARGS